ncbi:MAG: helix-turn-helix transcriptional regulator [Bacteroidota bacterium]|nr:helix-turn-helix transcriptional regulator [Bacteroidota bacterium]
MKKNNKKISKASNECPFRQTLDTLEGKWKFAIIYELLKKDKYRFKELERQVEGITPRMLIKELKALEKSDIINRQQYPTIPPKVEYSLTEHGASLEPIMTVMTEWGKKHLERIRKN